jgi:hypothetical protein
MLVPPPRPAPRQPFALETLARLPLAEAFYTWWAHLATQDVLEELFAQHRGRCYQDQLRFAELVEVLSDALTRYHGSGRRAIADALRRQQLSTPARAVYGKLARLPLPLAEAFLATLTARLRPLFPAGLYRTALPVSLTGLAVVILDGKKIKKAAKRLLATRGRPGKLYGGKLLAAYPAVDLLAVYLTRWQIENVFQAITEVFELRPLIGCTPRATVFQASLCRVRYNVLQVLRGYAAAAAPEPVAVETLSAEQIFTDLHEELVGLHRVLSVEELLGCLPPPPTAEQVRARLRTLLGRAWSAAWRKAANKKRRPHKPKRKELGAHTSVHKILEAAKAASDKTQKPSVSSG